MNIAQKITQCLWFDNEAEEAMKFYVDVFNNAPFSKKNSQITNIIRYAKDMEVPQPPEMTGKVLVGNFELEGQKFVCLDGGPIFKFNESLSLQVECKDQKEVDYFWEKLSAVPESEICGWLKDKYGLSWQIVPKRLIELVSDKEPDKVNRAVNAMLKMKKIVVADLEKAVSAQSDSYSEEICLMKSFGSFHKIFDY